MEQFLEPSQLEHLLNVIIITGVIASTIVGCGFTFFKTKHSRDLIEGVIIGLLSFFISIFICFCIGITFFYLPLEFAGTIGIILLFSISAYLGSKM